MSTVTKNYTCDILELPDYLSQQAKQGLMIKKITSARLYFTQDTPAELDYKIIPVNNNTEFDHLKELPGWTPLLNYGEFVLLSAPAGTPFTMAVDSNITRVKLSFMRTMHVIRLFLACIGVGFSAAIFLRYFVVHSWLCLIGVLFGITLAVFAVMELLPLIRLQRSLNRLSGKDVHCN